MPGYFYHFQSGCLIIKYAFKNIPYLKIYSPIHMHNNLPPNKFLPQPHPSHHQNDPCPHIHFCPYCQCSQGRITYPNRQRSLRISSPTRSPMKIITVLGANLHHQTVPSLRSESPRPQKVIIRCQSPPPTQSNNFQHSLNVENKNGEDWSREPRPKILDRKKKNHKPLTSMELTFNPGKGLQNLHETQITRIQSIEDSQETPIQSKEGWNDIQLGLSKQTYFSITGSQNSIEKYL